MVNKKMKKVLVVEDDHFLSKIYKLKLTKSNLDVYLATDGDQAIKMIKKIKPDLMLLDMVLPGKDGFEVLEAISSNKSLKKIPVIILSNLGQDSDISKGKSYGIVDYFVKSDISIHDVVKKIKEVLNEK